MTEIDYAVNIMNTYKRATPDEILEGVGWYGRAQALALELSPEDVWRGAGVLSALSPLKKWNQNVRLARRAFETGIATGNIGAHNLRAQRILDGEPALDVLRGPKTRSFCIAIASGGNGDIATIDRHAFDIAVNRILTDKTRNITDKRYRDIALAYNEVAEYVGASVNDIQAITWVVWRREKGVK